MVTVGIEMKTLNDIVEEQKANTDILNSITKPFTPAELQEIAELEDWDKMETLNDQIDNMEVKNPGDVKKLFPFVITRDYTKFSSWHGATVTYTDYGFKKNGKEFWFGRRTSNKDASYDYDDILVILNTYKKSNFKFACNYCGKGMLGSPNKFLNPLDFITWVKENKYQFDPIRTSIQNIGNGYWRFTGNLDKCSCAFWFDIFDKDIIQKIIKETEIKLNKKQ